MSENNEKHLTPSILISIASSSLEKEIQSELDEEDSDDIEKAERLIKGIKNEGH